jgi:hypothetical protein
LRFRPLALAAALALLLSGCAETTQFDAAADVRAFLISIRDGDRATFDAHVDRAALKTQLRARLLAEAAKRRDGAGDLAALGVLLGRPLVDALADALIQPDVFRAVAGELGYSAQTPIPGRLTITEALRALDADTVCVAKSRPGPCVLVFRNEDGVWRLVGFEGDVATLRTPRIG